MSALSPLQAALGWALLNFLWQGALAGFATAFLLRLLRGASAQARHIAACLGLLACLAAPVVTLIHLWPEPVPQAIQSAGFPEQLPLPPQTAVYR